MWCSTQAELSREGVLSSSFLCQYCRHLEMRGMKASQPFRYLCPSAYSDTKRPLLRQLKGPSWHLPSSLVTVLRAQLWKGRDPSAPWWKHCWPLWEALAEIHSPAPSGRKQLACAFLSLLVQNFSYRNAQMNARLCVWQSCAHKEGAFCKYFMALRWERDGRVRELMHCMCTCTFSCSLHSCACICVFPYCI